MTPLPKKHELATRQLYNPLPGTVNLTDLINMVKDGVYAKDFISDYVTGLLIVAARGTKRIQVWEGTLFQRPFVRNMEIRIKEPHYGHPFVGPDGLPMRLGERRLYGGKGKAGVKFSNLTLETLEQHPNFHDWYREHFHFDGATYVRLLKCNSRKACDDNVNSKPYVPGPGTRPPRGAAAANEVVVDGETGDDGDEQ
jgi:hypothetical protein